jgi:uncharacterized repeat protein (TIGR03803 family)
MKNPQLVSFRALFGLMFACAALGIVISAHAQTETTIYTFPGGNSAAPLFFDGEGNLFGATNPTGFGSGTVFQLSQTAGGWNATTLYTFGGFLSAAPVSTNLLMDAAGNLYGATDTGGTPSGNCSLAGGCGAIFQLSPDGKGGWTETTLYSFGLVSTDAAAPLGHMAMDVSGNLYGTTLYGGKYNVGTVFELSPQAGGGWTEKILHNFGQTGTSGGSPRGGVVLDPQGNLYGTTTYGGPAIGTCGSGCGTVFKLSYTAGKWKAQTLHIFHGTDGAYPTAAISFDSAGNIYSTTNAGGKNSVGVAFQLRPNSTGGWQFRLLHTFNGTWGGLDPESGVVLDVKGNLYGATREGGKFQSACQGASGCGLVYELKPTLSGLFNFRVLHNFTGGSDGYLLDYPLTWDSSGNLFGTTELGSISGKNGAVFEITP